MTKPTIANNSPAKVALEKDKKYFFCVCGKSTKQPFCDGSHKDSGMTPLAFTAEESKDYWLCQCKYSSNQPFCDGSHKQFGDDQVGSEPGQS